MADEAPKRIWIDPLGWRWKSEQQLEVDVPYVRADLVEKPRGGWVEELLKSSEARAAFIEEYARIQASERVWKDLETAVELLREVVTVWDDYLPPSPMLRKIDAFLAQQAPEVEEEP